MTLGEFKRWITEEQQRQLLDDDTEIFYVDFHLSGKLRMEYSEGDEHLGVCIRQ